MLEATIFSCVDFDSIFMPLDTLELELELELELPPTLIIPPPPLIAEPPPLIAELDEKEPEVAEAAWKEPPPPPPDKFAEAAYEEPPPDMEPVEVTRPASSLAAMCFWIL